jgi:hypothetical protein
MEMTTLIDGPYIAMTFSALDRTWPEFCEAMTADSLCANGEEFDAWVASEERLDIRLGVDGLPEMYSLVMPDGRATGWRRFDRVPSEEAPR